MKKAAKVIAIDSDPFRLEIARKLGKNSHVYLSGTVGAETIDIQEKEATSEIKGICPEGLQFYLREK